MSAGAVQLAAIGQQDAYLTGTPSVSYFTGVYRRHTPFTLQAFSVPFQGQQIQWGTQAVCRIPYKGDLVRSVMLSVDLPALAPASANYIWRLSVGQQRPVPYLYVNGNLVTPNVVTPVSIDTYSTGTIATWLTASSLGSKVFYDSQKTKFYFQNCSNVTVNVADVTTVGVFWGLDPKNYSRLPTSNTVQWDVGSGGARGNYADFSLAQAGWIPEAAATLVNSSATWSANIATSVTLNYITPTSTGTWAQFVNLGLFAAAQGVQTLITTTTGGSFRFAVTGTYMLIISLNISLPVTRIGVGHSATDGHPIGAWSWNDYAYEFMVVPMPQTPLAVIPINCTDTTQNYFIDLETLSSAPVTIGSLALGSEISITDIDEIYSLTTNQALVNATANLAVNWTRNGSTPYVNVNPISNTFQFTSTGLYHLKGTLFTTGANVFSVTMSNTAVGPITTWKTTQSRSPSINFTLPVQVWNTNDKYLISLTTDTTATLTANSFFGSEQFGVVTSTTSTAPKQNGLLFTGNVLSQFTSGTVVPVNFKQTMNVAGVSSLISITNNGNIKFSNVGAYRFMVYFDADVGYVSNVSLYQNYVDSRPVNPVYITASPLTLGTQGPYAIDVTAQCTNVSNVFFLDVTTVGSGTTNVSANAYVTILGTTSATPNTYYYVDSVGTYLVEKAELKIGGQLIQTLTGEMVEIFNDLTVPQENQTGLTLMTGKLDTSVAAQDRTYYVNLPLYFYGSTELAIPVCALQRQDMEVFVTFRPFLSLVANNTVVNQTNITASMIVEYAYLSDPEVNWMNSHVLDYVITQTQVGTFRLSQGTVFDLDFMGPVRELLFVVQDDSASPYSYVTDQGMGALMTFNGEDFIDQTTADYQFMHLIQPLEKHTRQPDRTVYMYAMSRRPQDPRPSGSINMSRIKQKKFQIFLPGTTSLETKELRVIAVSYNVLRISNGLAGLMYD